MWRCDAAATKDLICSYFVTRISFLHIFEKLFATELLFADNVQTINMELRMTFLEIWLLAVWGIFLGNFIL